MTSNSLGCRGLCNCPPSGYRRLSSYESLKWEFQEELEWLDIGIDDRNALWEAMWSILHPVPQTDRRDFFRAFVDCLPSKLDPPASPPCPLAVKGLYALLSPTMRPRMSTERIYRLAKDLQRLLDLLQPADRLETFNRYAAFFI